MNTRGSYRCECEVGSCGHGCGLEDPCYPSSPCLHGQCKADCTNVQDYKCECDEHWSGKNCSQNIVSTYLCFNMCPYLHVILFCIPLSPCRVLLPSCPFATLLTICPVHVTPSSLIPVSSVLLVPRHCLPFSSPFIVSSALVSPLFVPVSPCCPPSP